MKKLLFLATFFFAVGIATSNAQSCSGTASAGKSCCASKMAKAAAADPTIEKRVADNGTVSYVRKETDATGMVAFVSVQYDEAQNAFVNVAPKSAAQTTAGTDITPAAAPKACAGGEKKACCASGQKKACAGEKTEQE